MTASDNTLPVLTFYIDDQCYGLAIDRVIEVASMVTVISTPSEDPAVIGVVNRHGEILPMLDLRQIFSNSEPTPIDSTMLFIVGQVNDRRVGLIVDSIRQVEYLSKRKMTLSSSAGNYIHGIISYNDVLIQLITLEPLFAQYITSVVMDDESIQGRS